MKPEPLPRSFETRHPARNRRPDFQPSAGGYQCRFVNSDEDLQRVLRLRYEVFNLELGEGLDESHALGLDCDRFDAHCDHLMVVHEATNEVVGTYRLQLYQAAMAGQGFYSAQEFQLDALPIRVLEASLEIGRASIAREHRHRYVLLLLWQGLTAYALSNRARYMFGCCSLTSQDAAEGTVAYEHLIRNSLVHEQLHVPPQPEVACDIVESARVGWKDYRLPKLFRTYLRYGVKVCGPPAIDREFKTIDFLALLDVVELTSTILVPMHDGDLDLLP